MIRPDLIFSYWVFVWWLAYMYKLTHFNPRFAIMLGIIENIFMVGLMKYVGTPSKYIIFFLVMFVVMKGVPYYTVQNTHILKKDVLFTFALFALYLFWCWLNHFSIYNVITSITSKKYDLPGMMFLDYVLLRF